MAEAAVALGVLLVILTAVRAALARGVLRTGALREDDDGARRGPAPDLAGVTVLQAIRSGDPLLPHLLAENLATTPGARFVWLVDADDPPGQRAAAQAISAARASGSTPDVEVVLAPPLPQGRNPKVFKLALALPRCGEVLAVLDDDVVLPPGALARAVGALANGDLVTGVPVYREQGSLASRLVAAFVNGSSLLTYLPLARLSEPVTINGMFYVARRSTLEALGGFAAIEDRLCDDYELARLYRSAGRRIVQAPVVHPLATTVPGPRAYARIMRRWMVFGRHVLGEDLTPAVLALVVLPAVLPLAAALAALASRSAVAGVVVALALAVKVTTTALLRRGAPPAPASPAGAALEVVADLLLPVHLVAAAVRPRRVTWRDRRIDAGPDGLVLRDAA